MKYSTIYSIFVMFMSIDKTRKAKDHKNCISQKKAQKNKLIANRKNYANLEPAKEKIRLEKAASKYKSMDVVKKKDLLQKSVENIYKSMDPMKKNDL